MPARILPVLLGGESLEEVIVNFNELSQIVTELLIVGERGGLDRANVQRRGLSYRNIDWVPVAYASNAIANTEDTVTHNLGRIPIGYIVVDRDKAGVIYSSNKGAWTTTTMRLKGNVASTATTLLVF